MIIKNIYMNEICILVEKGTFIKNNLKKIKIKNLIIIQVGHKSLAKEKFKKKYFIKDKKSLNIFLNKNFKNKNNFYFINFTNIIFKKNTVNNFKNRLFNFHPSYLPEYKGLNAFTRAYNTNGKSGCTVYLINENIDDGKIIIRNRYLIKKKKSLEENWLILERLILAQFSKLIKMILLDKFK